MIVFVDVLGTGIVTPVIPLYAQGAFNATPLQITALTTVFFAAQFVAAPQLGRLSDRVGRRPVLILSQIGTASALFLSGAAPAMLFLYIARVIDGITGGNITVAQAYLTDITDDSNRARGLGIINAAFSSGFIFGPAFGALMAARFGPRVPFYIAGCVSILTVTLSTFLLPELLTEAQRVENRQTQADQKTRGHTTRETLTRWQTLLRLPGVWLIMLIAFGGQFGFFSFQTTWVLWAEAKLFAGYNAQFVQQAVGYILTFIGVAGIITQIWLIGPLVSRHGEKRLVFAGQAMRVVAYASFAVLPLLAPTLLVVPLLSIGGGIMLPSLLALLTYVTPRQERGEAIGLVQSVQNVGRILGPLMGGWLFQQVNPGAPMGAAAIISGLTLFAALALIRMPTGGERVVVKAPGG